MLRNHVFSDSLGKGTFLLVLVLGFLITGHYTSLTRNSAVEQNQFVAPPHGLEHFLFGFQVVTSDLFWIRSIQDFDFCERARKQEQCRQSGWLFQMLDVITDLDPQYRMAYAAGGLALTVIISDISGASRIFDKGVANFPHDWKILYRAAYQALYEEKDYEKAGLLLESAGHNGAPDWVFNLAGRLYTEAGKRDLAERMLSELDESSFDETIKERMRQKFHEKIQLSETNPNSTAEKTSKTPRN